MRWLHKGVSAYSGMLTVEARGGVTQVEGVHRSFVCSIPPFTSSNPIDLNPRSLYVIIRV